MKYKVSFLDNKGYEFMGTTRHFTTDGRYSLDTVHDIARDTKNKLMHNNDIHGYVVRLNSFNSDIIKTVILR